MSLARGGTSRSDADRAGEVPVLAGRGVGLGQQPPARGAAGHEALDHGAVLAQERRRHLGAGAGLSGAPSGGARRAAHR